MKKGILLVVLVLLIGTLTPVLAQRNSGKSDAQAVADRLADGRQAVVPGDLLADEQFDVDTSWEDFEGDNSSGQVLNGTYQMQVEENYFVFEIDRDDHTDVIIEVDTEQLSKSLVNSYGLMCRADPEYSGAGYYFWISGDGYYAIQKHTGKSGEFETLVDWEESKVINQGRDSNHITAVCAGDYLALYVGDTLLAEATDRDYSEGRAGLTVSAYDSGSASVAFDNLRVWEALTDSKPSSVKPPKNSTVRLVDYAGQPQSVVRELQNLGFVSPGGGLVFTEDRAFFTGQGSWFTPLARRSPNTHIIMAGELTFTVGSANDLEQCSLMARIGMDSSGAATTFAEVGLTNAGELYILDRFSPSSNANVTVGETILDISRPVHIVFTMIGSRANVFVDGELALSDVPIQERGGIYGIALVGKGAGARCEGRNIWVYQVPSGRK